MIVSDNKRIARNTLFLYFRMVVVMGVTLFTSRVILEALGVEDFGIYNLVGGVSSSLVFFSSTLSTTAQRFMNYELARERGNWVKIFNLSFLIFTILSVLTLILGITVGRWFVTTRLVIPEAQMGAALQVLYATTLGLVLTFLFSAYEAVLITHENMKIYAWLGLVDAFGKLAISYLLYLFAARLIVYAWLLFAVLLLPKLVIVGYCHRRYKELSLKRVWEWDTIREMFGFAGWNLFNALVWLVNDQGVTFMLNIFFGPVVNAARAVAVQVNNAVFNFSLNFLTAFRPQIVKRYAAKEYTSMVELVLASSRYSVYLLWLISLPIVLRARFVLSLWLVDVPAYSVSFIQGIFYFAAVNAFSLSYFAAVTATGHMRHTCLWGNILYLTAFPAIYIALKLGADTGAVYPILAVTRVLYVGVTVVSLRRYVPLKLSEVFHSALLPTVAVVVCSFGACAMINMLFPNTFLGLVGNTAVCIATTSTIIYTVGITPRERSALHKKATTLLQKLRR